MFCGNCGSKRNASHKFCTQCGAGLSMDAQEVSQFAVALETSAGSDQRSAIDEPPRSAMPGQFSSQERLIRPWYKAWLWAASISVLGFGLVQLPATEKTSSFGSAVFAAAIGAIVLVFVGAILSIRSGRPVSIFLEQRPSLKNARKKLMISCVILSISVIAPLFSSKSISEAEQIVYFFEAAFWFFFACFPASAISQAGKLSILALVRCITAKQAAELGTDIATMVYAGAFAMFFQVWIENRFKANLLQTGNSEGNNQQFA
jgi:hypothetical protein